MSQDPHLTFPTFEDAPEPAVPTKQVLHDRLYVGNLHPSVDEYALLQLFTRYAKVTKLDFLFHKSGPLKGKPRGYAFVEFGNTDDALKALAGTHDKLFRGRKLVVTHAHQAPLDGNSAVPRRKAVNEAGRPTTLSIIKTGSGSRNAGTENKIAMMEAKLRQMEQESHPTSSSLPPPPPSLPVKPPPPKEITTSARMSLPRPAPLPIITAAPSSEAKPFVAKKPKTPLAGVKIIKPKKADS